MPTLNFKERFAELVRTGLKRQTIRKKRKRPIKQRDILYCYCGLRKKNPDHLGTYKCKSTERIEIQKEMRVMKRGRHLMLKEIRALAKAYGFKDEYEFFAFFSEQYGLPFIGVLIKW